MLAIWKLRLVKLIMFINNIASIVQQGPDDINELSSYKLVDDF